MPIADDGIYLLTGPVRSGKTTSLIAWAEKRDDVYGILTPVINGKRMFMDANSRVQFDMEAAAGETDILAVGRFRFSKAGFDKARQVIQDAMAKEGWLIIDEIGPLELKGEGFCVVLKEVLAQRKNKILLVVREGLQEEAQKRFRFEAGLVNPGTLRLLH